MVYIMQSEDVPATMYQQKTGFSEWHESPKVSCVMFNTQSMQLFLSQCEEEIAE